MDGWNVREPTTSPVRLGQPISEIPEQGRLKRSRRRGQRSNSLAWSLYSLGMPWLF